MEARVTKRTARRLEIKRETLRRLADGDLARVAGGYMARCTYEKSGCFPHTNQTCGCSGGTEPI